MEPPSDYSRRNALSLGGGLLALVIGGGAGWLDRRGTDTETLLSPTTTTLGPPPSSDLAATIDRSTLADLDPDVADLGRRYLSQHPEEANLETLLSLLPDPTDNPIEAARSVVTSEFRSSDTVSIAGWVLATSEARAAAVVALVCRPSGDGEC